MNASTFMTIGMALIPIVTMIVIWAILVENDRLKREIAELKKSIKEDTLEDAAYIKLYDKDGNEQIFVPYDDDI